MGLQFEWDEKKANINRRKQLNENRNFMRSIDYESKR